MSQSKMPIPQDPDAESDHIVGDPAVRAAIARGKRPVRREKVEKLAAQIGVTVAHLVKDQGLYIVD